MQTKTNTNRASAHSCSRRGINESSLSELVACSCSTCLKIFLLEFGSSLKIWCSWLAYLLEFHIAKSLEVTHLGEIIFNHANSTAHRSVGLKSYTPLIQEKTQLYYHLRSMIICNIKIHIIYYYINHIYNFFILS